MGDARRESEPRRAKVSDRAETPCPGRRGEAYSEVSDRTRNSVVFPAPYPTRPAFPDPKGAPMWTLLARGGASTSTLVRRALRPPVGPAQQARRTIVLAVVGLAVTSASALGTLALTTEPDAPSRGFVGISDVRMVRDLQLPTL